MTTAINYISPPFPTKPCDFRERDWAGVDPIIQEKLNGVRALVHRSGRVFSKAGREFRGLREWMPTLELPSHINWLDGEILSDTATLQTIAGVVNSFEPAEAELASIYIAAFDYVGQAPCCERLDELEHLDLPPKLRKIPWQRTTAVFANTLFHTLESLKEGLIYRHAHAGYKQGATRLVQKRKRMHTEEFKCLSVHEGLGKFAGMFGGAVLEMKDGRTFRCGGGLLTVQDRINLWVNKPIGCAVTVQFPYKSDTGVPLQAQWVAVRNYE